MATITLTEARARAVKATQVNFGMRKTATAVLAESIASQTTDKTYDIFMSHPVLDAEVILGVKGILQDYGYSVYIDWIDDPQLDRKNVTPETASTLRNRMNLCKSLFYTTTENSPTSRWMPWECGYFDGKKSRTAILPVTAAGTDAYKGQEYLGLYPYISDGTRKSDSKKCLWVHHSPDIYVEFDSWLQGKEPTKH